MKPNSGPKPQPNRPDEDPDAEFEIDYLDRTKAREREGASRVFYAKVGGFALAVAMTTATLVATKQRQPASATTIVTNDTETGSEPVITFEPTVTVDVETPPTAPPLEDLQLEQAEIENYEFDLVSQANATELQAIAEAEQLLQMKQTLIQAEQPIPLEQTTLPEQSNQPEQIVQPIEEIPTPAVPVPDYPQTDEILNSVNGHINGPTGDETYYNLPMDHIVDRMHRLGVEGEYWVREDGVKMLGNYIMVAANLKVHPRGSIVETSLGTGIVCDTGSFAEKHPNRLDIATNW